MIHILPYIHFSIVIAGREISAVQHHRFRRSQVHRNGPEWRRQRIERGEISVQPADARQHEIHLLAIEMEGTTTGEHGVGAVRRKYAPLEHGMALEYMKKTKQAFDPKGIMNPGKLI